MSEAPEAFFDERGFVLRFHEADGFVWADLRARRSADFEHPRYGCR